MQVLVYGTSSFEFSKRRVITIIESRGDLADIKALLEALVNKRIAAAGLDVLPAEPTIREEAELLRPIFTEKHDLNTLFAGHILGHLPQVLVTLHSAFNTREAKKHLLNTTVDNIIAFPQGKPQNEVT